MGCLILGARLSKQELDLDLFPFTHGLPIRLRRDMFMLPIHRVWMYGLIGVFNRGRSLFRGVVMPSGLSESRDSGGIQPARVMRATWCNGVPPPLRALVLYGSQRFQAFA